MKVDVWLVAFVSLLPNTLVDIVAVCHAAAWRHREVSTDLHEARSAMQGRWLVFGGFPVPAEDEMTKMFAFDFSTLSWSLLDLTGTPLQHRMSYLAACHEDSLVVVGGICFHCSCTIPV